MKALFIALAIAAVAATSAAVPPEPLPVRSIEAAPLAPTPAASATAAKASEEATLCPPADVDTLEEYLLWLLTVSAETTVTP